MYGCLRDLPPEADSDLRRDFAAKAKERNRSAKRRAGRTSGETRQQHTGALQLGDANYPVSPSNLSVWSQQKAAVKTGSGMWQKLHAECAPDGTIPDESTRSHCSDICVSKLDFAAAEHLHNACHKLKGLLLNICRGMKSMVREASRRLTETARHPLVLFRCGGKSMGWALTSATFKPLTLDGVRLRVPTPFAPPCRVMLDFVSVPESDQQLLAFASLKKMVYDVVKMYEDTSTEEECKLMWCYNPAYKLRASATLATLHLEEPLSWCDFDELPVFEEGDDGADSGDDDALQGEDADLSSMIQSLLGQSRTAHAKSKSSRRSASQAGALCAT